MTRRFRWLAIPVALTALVLAACGDEETTGDGAADSTGANGTTSTATAEVTPGEATTTPGDESTPASGGEVGTAELAALAERVDSATFTATYTITAPGEEMMDGTWEWTQDGESDRRRFDIQAEGENLTMLITEEAVVFCAEGGCFSMDGAGGGMMPDLGELFTGEIESIEDSATSATVTAAPSQDLAGTEAECFDFNDETAGTSGTLCYSPEGIPLLIDAQSPDGDFRMEATAYSTDVDEAVFEPPFPVTAFPGMGG